LLLVAAAALIDGEGRVLLAQRPEGKALAGLWEFPGGKLEVGEAPEAALARELHEELGIMARPGDFHPCAFASHAGDGFHLLMPLWTLRRWTGEPVAQEGQTLAWVAPENLGARPMPPADVPLAERLAVLLSEGRA
jgi:8-oxo-dGTP diphosphatase